MLEIQRLTSFGWHIIPMDFFRHCYLSRSKVFPMKTSKVDLHFKIDEENQRRYNNIHGYEYKHAFLVGSYPCSFYFSSLYTLYLPNKHIFFHRLWLIFIFKEIQNCSWHNEVRKVHRLNSMSLGFD